MGRVDRDPANSSLGEQPQALGSIELDHLGRGTQIAGDRAIFRR